MTGKAVLAFSGGLDTSVVVRYLQVKHDLDVITVTVDVGQGDDKRKVEQKAKKLGAKRHYHIDAQQEFIKEYVYRAIKTNALYQRKYSLATALARPLIAEKLVGVAKKENATHLSHGCSGKGNDQVRFDLALRAKSKLPIIAPIRDMNLTRDTELDFAKENAIEIEETAKKFSIDQNLWGRAIEGGVLEDPFVEPPDEVFEWVRTNDFPDKPKYLDIEFVKGIPVKVDGKKLSPIELVNYVNKKAGKSGVGIVDHIEDRIVGIKSREVYESPAASCLIEAHRDLEKMVLTNQQNRFKELIDDQWAWLVYAGLWNEPLRKDIDQAVNSTQKSVTGTVRIKMYKGSLRVVGRKSTKSLYRHRLATYGTGSSFDQFMAKGFVELWGMQSTEANKLVKDR